MWVFTKEGFFSVVHNHYCKPGELAVRARKKNDLERFCQAAGLDAQKILTTEDADYRYRLHVTKKKWSKYIAAAAMDIDYPNFKNATCKNDPGRSRAYHDCWSALNYWQNEF